MNIKHKHTTIARRFALIAALGILATPAIGSAQLPAYDGAAPVAAGDDDDDPPCGQAVIALEIDVDTGNVYIVDGLSGGLTLTDNQINVSFGTMTSVLIDIEYSHSDWEVTVDPDQDPEYVGYTRGGTFRHYIDLSNSTYVFSSDFVSGGGGTETPIVPDVIIVAQPDCPPET